MPVIFDLVRFERGVTGQARKMPSWSSPLGLGSGWIGGCNGIWCGLGAV